MGGGEIKRQETKGKRQEARDKREETRGKQARFQASMVLCRSDKRSAIRQNTVP